MSCGVDCAMLLWLWCRLVATAPIGPLAWESLYTMGAAQEKVKRQKKKKKKKEFPTDLKKKKIKIVIAIDTTDIKMIYPAINIF